MSQQNALSFFQSPRALSFPAILATGAMIATLLVVAYAGLVSPESAVRVHIVLQGAEVILLTLAAGIIAGTLHAVGIAADARRSAKPLPALRQSLAS